MDAIIEMYQQQKKNKKEIKQTQDREILQKPITSFTILSIWPEALSKMGGKKKKTQKMSLQFRSPKAFLMDFLSQKNESFST